MGLLRFFRSIKIQPFRGNASKIFYAHFNKVAYMNYIIILILCQSNKNYIYFLIFIEKLKKMLYNIELALEVKKGEADVNK